MNQSVEFSFSRELSVILLVLLSSSALYAQSAHPGLCEPEDQSELYDPFDFFDESSEENALTDQQAIEVLINHGVKINHEENTWDFREAELSPKAIKESQNFEKALRQLIVSEVVDQLLDENRKVAIVIGEQVILPPRTRKWDQQQIAPVYELTFYEELVQRELQAFDKDVQGLTKAAKKVGSYSNLMTGQLRGERGYEGRTAPEIEADMYHDSISHRIQRLRDHLGVNPELMEHLNEANSALSEFRRSEIDRGISKLKKAKVAALAAPAIPVVMWATPVVFGAAGVAGAPTAAASGVSSFSLTSGSTFGAASVTTNYLALTPLGLGHGVSAAKAYGDKKHGQAGFWESYQENLADDGTTGLIISPIAALGPLISLGGGAGLSASTSLSLNAGTGWVSTGFGVAGLGLGGYGASESMKRCNQMMLELHQSKAQGASQEALEEAAALVFRACLDAGVDIGTLLVGGYSMTKSGVARLRGRMGVKPTKPTTKPATSAKTSSTGGNTSSRASDSGG